MSLRTSLALPLLLGACASGPSTAGAPMSLTPPHAAAIRDSVLQFLQAYGADLSAPPIGTKARDALARFYAPDLVVSSDLAPDEPTLVQTADSLIPADEVVSVPAWIRSTRFEWGTTVITPLAPGLAVYTAKYTEAVTDTSGTVTVLPGAQHGVVRNGPTGWRFITIQSSHPMAMHRRQAELVARVAGAK